MTCYFVIISSTENQTVVYAFLSISRFLHNVLELDELYRMVLVLEFNFE